MQQAHRQPREAQRDAGEEQHDGEEHGDEHVIVGVLGRFLALLEADVAEPLELVGLHRLAST